MSSSEAKNLEVISKAIDHLPDDQRTTLIMVEYHHMQYQEIAEILDCPIGTVRSRLHRGRKALQRELWHIAEEHGITAALTAEGDK